MTNNPDPNWLINALGMADDDVVQIDQDAVPDIIPDKNSTPLRDRFIASMKLSNIKIIHGDYESRNSELDLQCDICNHTWTAIAQKARLHGCPKCKELARNTEKELELWKRSKKIIQDKMGKIVKFTQREPGQTPSVNDEFLLKCHEGHRFLLTHKKLRNNQWCPLCIINPGYKPKLRSAYTYRKNMTNEQKFEKYKEIAIMKGSVITNKHHIAVTESYKLLCTHCATESMRTARQISRNAYLCDNKCIKGNIISIYSF